MTLTQREPKYGYCHECGAPIHNQGAHAEACTGKPDVRPAGRLFPIVPPKARGCPARVPANRNLWRYCMRPYGHEGGHIYDD